ncbi:MAG: alanine/ornithine racemase family PLP-dependent enzyme [Clostridia bacterium]|nr:alanine/ornithine racemase family PLP-dependent enzyme [Clostridia bacterium]
MYPKVTAHMGKLAHNLNYLCDLCHSKGLSVAVVTKVFCADENIVRMIQKSDADYLADSRIPNLVRCAGGKPRILLRISSPSAVEHVIENSEISLQSEPYTIKKLADAAKQAGKKHKTVLMIDLGDLREGIYFEEEKLIYDACETVLASENLELYGIGTNLTCYGGILPDKRNLGNLVAISKLIRQKYGVELPFVSGGNSSTLEFLKSGGVPEGITNLRLGESFVLGNDTAVCKVMDGMYGDAVTLDAELIEIKNKPSKPVGTSGRNAFGEEVHFEDKGDMLRGILAIGRQDVDEGGIHCTENNIQVIGASSDHLLVDLKGNKGYNIGDVLTFTMEYGAVLKAFTSSYVDREYTNN